MFGCKVKKAVSSPSAKFEFLSSCNAAREISIDLIAHVGPSLLALSLKFESN